MSDVRQIASEHESSVIESGALLPVPFGDPDNTNADPIDADGDSTMWIPCGWAASGSMWVDPGVAGSTITVEGRRTKNAPVEDIVASGAVVDAGAAVMDATDITGFSHIRVTSNGTITQVTLFYLFLRAG